MCGRGAGRIGAGRTAVTDAGAHDAGEVVMSIETFGACLKGIRFIGLSAVAMENPMYAARGKLTVRYRA